MNENAQSACGGSVFGDFVALQILLVSANNALLSRLVLDDMADQGMRTKFGRLAFGMEYEMVIDRVEWHTRAQRMLENSGIQQLEEQVFGFLHKHSGPIKMLSLLDDVVKLLQVCEWEN